MKKLLAILLSVLLVLTVFVSCSKETSAQNGSNIEEQNNKHEVNEKQKNEIKSFDDLMQEMLEADLSYESFSADMDMEMAMKVKAEGFDMSMDINADILLETALAEGLSHIAMSINAAGETTSIELYNDSAFTYTCEDGTWYKQEIVEGFSKEEMQNYLEKAKSIDFDYSKYIFDETFEKVNYNEKNCYKSTYKMSIKLKEMLEDLGELGDIYDEDLSGLFPDEQTTALAEDLLSDLGTVAVIQYVDADTLYPVYAEIDMTETINNVLYKAIELSEEESEIATIKDSLTIDKVIVKVSFTDINKISITIPEEALNAPNIDDIYFEDDYFDDEYYDDMYYDDMYYDEIA